MGGVEATYAGSPHAISDGSRVQVVEANPDVYGGVQSLHGEYESHAVTASGDLRSLARGEIRRHETLASGESLPTGRTWLSLAPDAQSHLEQAKECNRWLEALLAAGARVVVPEIADYEVRREPLRAKLTASIERLDGLKQPLGVLPFDSRAFLTAAEFWAQARRMDRSTADDRALDGDTILCAQAAQAAGGGHKVVIATTNVKHLTLFADAREWQAAIREPL